jgi:uncharacterized membrane-anchored protein
MVIVWAVFAIGAGICSVSARANGQATSQTYTGGTANAPETMQDLRNAADAGNADAMFNIGYLYDTGQGIAQDYQQAMTWYLKAASLGNIAAMNNIGVLYASGRGVIQDYTQAMTWYLKAADGGDTAAMFHIGLLYATGQGVSRNYEQALAWCRKAADAGNEDAKKCLDEITAQENAASPLDKINWTVGPAHIRVGKVGQLDLPTGYRFADSQQAILFETATQNPHDPDEIGVIVPPAEAFTDPNTAWYVMLTYKDVGHVDDGEKDNLDDTTAGEILDAIRAATDKANLERSRKGWAPLKIAGWDQRPFYDPLTHDLTWAIRGSCTSPDGNGDVTNYQSIILGRSGCVDATLAIPPAALTATVPDFQMLVKRISFVPGQTYEDFQAGDRVSNYGLTALITGGTAVAIAKGWPVAIVFAKKLILAIGAIFAAAVAKVKSLFRRKSSQQTVAA